MKKQIIIDISDEGEIQLETQGFQGKSCIEESEFIKEILGKEILKKLIPAYYTKQKSQKVSAIMRIK